MPAPTYATCIVAVLLLAAPAATASPLDWSGTLTFLLGQQTMEARGGGVATVNRSSGIGHLDRLRLAASRGGISGPATVLVTDPDTVDGFIVGIRLDPIAVGSGTLSPISGAAASTSALVANELPVRGVVRLCLISTDCGSFLPLFLNQATTNGATLGVGVGGLLTIQGDSPIAISLVAAPWTLATVTVIDEITTTGGAQSLVDVALAGFVHDPASGTTTTGQPGGAVQLVTPTQISTNLRVGSIARIASGVVLRVHFIPEPGLLLLLGSGVAGLALLGHARLRK